MAKMFGKFLLFKLMFLQVESFLCLSSWSFPKWNVVLGPWTLPIVTDPSSSICRTDLIFHCIPDQVSFRVRYFLSWCGDVLCNKPAGISSGMGGIHHAVN